MNGQSAPTVSPDAPVVVIGGGAIGLCVAFHLLRQGVPVRVVERAAVGSGSSWGNAGWVCLSHSAPVPAPGMIQYAARSIGRRNSPVYLRPRLDPAFLSWLVQFSRSCNQPAFDRGYAAITRLNQATFDRFDELTDAGITTTLTRPGLVHAYLSLDEARHHFDVQLAMSGNGYEMPDRILTGGDIAGLDPALDGQAKAAYLVRGEGVLDPAAFTASLAAWLREHGALVDEQATAAGFIRDKARVVAVRTSDGEIPCSGVVVAAGVWSGHLLRDLGVRLPLQAGKGYSFSVKLSPEPEHPIYFGDKRVVVSPINGTTRFAGTMEFSGVNRNLEWRRLVAIAQASKSYLGEWYERPDDLIALIKDPWVGGRPMLPDGLPLIDRVPATPNAYVATGHGMLGITLAPVTGQLLTQLILTGQSPAELTPFSAARLHRSPSRPDLSPA